MCIYWSHIVLPPQPSGGGRPRMTERGRKRRRSPDRGHQHTGKAPGQAGQYLDPLTHPSLPRPGPPPQPARTRWPDTAALVPGEAVHTDPPRRLLRLVQIVGDQKDRPLRLPVEGGHIQHAGGSGQNPPPYCSLSRPLSPSTVAWKSSSFFNICMSGSIA